MCATPKYCNTFKEQIISDIISTAFSIVVLVGTGGGLGVLSVFTNVLTLTEKFSHPKCGEDSPKQLAAYRAEHAASVKALSKAEKAIKKGTAPAPTTPAPVKQVKKKPWY